jgi:hypothetical protein
VDDLFDAVAAAEQKAQVTFLNGADELPSALGVDVKTLEVAEGITMTVDRRDGGIDQFLIWLDSRDEQATKIGLELPNHLIIEKVDD